MIALQARVGSCYRAIALLALVLLASCVSQPRRDVEAPPPRPTAKPVQVDRVLVLKSRRMLYLMHGETVLQKFPVALGKSPIGPKRQLGDKRTPEGTYRLDWRNPKSQFYRSIHISYPSESDIKLARENHVAPGENVMIHGLPNGQGQIGAKHLATDWTDGCIALTDEEMDIVWRLVGDNTPIEIRP